MVALRIPAAVGWGAMINIGLFALLWSLVKVPIDLSTAITVDPIYTRPIVLTPVEPPVRPPKPPREIPLPPRDTVGLPIRDSEITRPGRGERITVPTFGTEIPTGTTALPVDGDPLPVIRVDPDYPQRAINGEIEGWVEVQFSVTAMGAVRDVVVVDSNPKNIFDEAVLRAVTRWRYNPKVEDGVAVERIGMRTRILFELGRAQDR